MGENANFTCHARGTNISAYWVIDGNEHRDCNNQPFCVNTTSGDSFVSSTLTIDTTQLRDTETMETVRCVVEQVFRGQADSSDSTGQLTVRASPTPLSPTTSKTHTHT